MKTPALLLTGALLWAAAGASHAQSAAERRFFAGIDVGQARINRDVPANSFGVGTDRDSTSWKLSFGYEFSPRFALEAAYTDFGDYDASELVALPAGASLSTAAAAAAPGDFRTSAKGMELAAVFSQPVGEAFYVSASVGLQRREFKTVFDPTMPNQPGLRIKDGDVGIRLGAGFGFRITEALDIGVNWAHTQHLKGDIDYLENEADPSMTSLGLRARF